MRGQISEAKAGKARLLCAEHLALAAQPQIFLGDPKTILGLAHDRDAGFRILAERRFIKQETRRLAAAAPDASAQLMQLRKPEPLGMLDHHDRRLRNIDTDLDDRCRDKNLG